MPDTRISPAVRSPTVKGCQTAIVTDTDDPDRMGRVRLSFPWLDDAATTDWVRVVEPYGVCPCERPAAVAVGHEVLVDFVGGDLRAPIVIGRLRNAADGPVGSR
ncbi:MAG TPA: phage baseplate assembly protein V [Myxococcota bacterium]|nr:phage baseplate assembly protein V [Myxococcota bacterium]